MKKGLTELVFIVDRSGSMAGLEKDTIGGFNAMLKEQAELAGEARVTTVLFDNQYRLLHDRIDIRAVAPLTEKDYRVGGGTALLDAIGRTMEKIRAVQKQTAEDYRAEKVLFVIITDGMENASTEFTKEKVKKLISDKQEKEGWDFIYLGANIDAAEEAGAIGVSKANAVTYKNTSSGVRANYDAVGVYVAERASGSEKSDAWKDHVEQDTGK